MQDDRFEWDDAKAAENEDKHKVTFELARLVFDDPYAEASPDDMAEGEHRMVTIGDGGGVVLMVISTERNGRTRIISARRATRHERRRLEEGYGPSARADR